MYFFGTDLSERDGCRLRRAGLEGGGWCRDLVGKEKEEMEVGCDFFSREREEGCALILTEGFTNVVFDCAVKLIFFSLL